MGRTYPEIDTDLATFMEKQKLFFVATAPLSAEGHVNLSPKGLDSFRILDPHSVAYLDLTGSGIETISHLRENGRISLLFCAFAGPPRILRLQGRGEFWERGEAGFDALASRFPDYAESRAIVRVQVTRISTSCGYGVPVMHFESERKQLVAWGDRKGSEGIKRFKQEHNSQSIDGLPGLKLLGD